MTRIEPSVRLPASPIDIVLCSSSGRWNAALRMALVAAIDKWPQLVLRLHEVEDFQQLDEALRDGVGAVVGVEVGEENLRAFLAWAATRRFDATPLVGLLSTWPKSWDEFAAEQRRMQMATLEAIVREAGAAWTLASPLEAMDFIEIAARCSQNAGAQPATAHMLDTAIWRTLPWQSNRAPLRLVSGEW